MRSLLTAVIICSLQIFCLGDVNPFEDTRIMSRAYPKQKHIPIHRNIQILNAQKFIRARPIENHKLNNKKQNLAVDGGSYTVFPSIGLKKKKITSFPESPYFPIESLFDQKPNKVIKKMLPDYGLWHLSRRKRSANSVKVTNSSNTDKTKKQKVKVSKDKKDDSSVATKKVLKSKSNVRSSVTRKQNLSRNLSRVSENKHKKATPKNVKASSAGNNIKNNNKNILRQGNAKKNPRKVSKQIKKTLRSGRSRNNKNMRRRSKKGGNNKKSKNMNYVTRVRRSETGGYDGKVFKGRRLIAGKDATIGEYPYVVSIQKNSEHWCAGALINQRIVITTANCVWKSDRISRLSIRAGSRHTDHGGQVADVQEVMRHPFWSIRRHPDVDVALLLLDRNIKFSHEVHAVDLPNYSMMPSFEDAWVTGWGTDRRDGIYENRPPTLQVFHARLMDHEKCNNITQRFGVMVTHNFICLSQIGTRAPCTRDTGAPAVSDGVLWGLASWGLRKLCGTERYPAMFSYVASLQNLEFIVNATHLLMSDQRHYPYPDRYREFETRTVKSIHTNTTHK